MTRNANEYHKIFLDISPTDFQKIFQDQKSETQQTKVIKQKKNIPSGGIFQNDEYYPTQAQFYNRFIRSVLKEIEHGKKDFCFKWYQIQELLKFHPFDLQCKLHHYDGNHGEYYFEVYLDTKTKHNNIN